MTGATSQSVASPGSDPAVMGASTIFFRGGRKFTRGANSGMQKSWRPF